MSRGVLMSHRLAVTSCLIPADGRSRRSIVHLELLAGSARVDIARCVDCGGLDWSGPGERSMNEPTSRFGLHDNCVGHEII